MQQIGKSLSLTEFLLIVSGKVCVSVLDYWSELQTLWGQETCEIQFVTSAVSD